MYTPSVSRFQVRLEVFPKNSGDLNIVCSSIYSEYKTLCTLLEALTYPQTHLKRLLSQILTIVDDATYSFMIKGLGTLNSALIEVMPKPFDKTLKLDSTVGVMGELLALTCTDFLNSLPQELFNLFRDIKNGINKMSYALMPGNIMGQIANSLIQIKDDIMKEMFGDLFTTVLEPFIMYDAFLQENGINDMIERMIRIERCMTKPGICNRDRKDFLHPDDNRLYSSHYKDQFLLSSRGTINIKSFGGTAKQKSQISNLIKSMNTFRLTIK
jgi:hypothetical protein